MNLDLFVDTSRKGISMAVANQTLYQEVVDEKARGETASAILDNLLELVNAKLDNIQRVMVTLGPGSFSGLRTGVAFCQGLCFSGKRKLYGVSSLQALECFGLQKSPASKIAVVIRARPEYWYLRHTINNQPEELFLHTTDLIKSLESNKNIETVVVDDAALKEESLKILFEKIKVQTLLDTAHSLKEWSCLFSSIKPSLIQEANYIQPSYFEKLK